MARSGTSGGAYGGLWLRTLSATPEPAASNFPARAVIPPAYGGAMRNTGKAFITGFKALYDANSVSETLPTNMGLACLLDPPFD